ncbi:MAG: HPF/RaiA family ribosome-associated protein [Myxococcota bacterium]
MTETVRITYHGMPRSEALDELIHERAEKLFQLFDRITSCRVVVEAPHRRHTKGNHFAVHLEIHVPGDVLVVSRDHNDARHEDPYRAVRDTFHAAVRMLRHYVQRIHAIG